MFRAPPDLGVQNIFRSGCSEHIRIWMFRAHPELVVQNTSRSGCSEHIQIWVFRTHPNLDVFKADPYPGVQNGPDPTKMLSRVKCIELRVDQNVQNRSGSKFLGYGSDDC